MAIVFICMFQDGVVKYVGITTDTARRLIEHARPSKLFDAIQTIPGLDELSRAAARGVEQVLIDKYGMEKNGGQLLNWNNSIDPARQAISAYATSVGDNLLKAVGFGQ